MWITYHGSVSAEMFNMLVQDRNSTLKALVNKITPFHHMILSAWNHENERYKAYSTKVN